MFSMSGLLDNGSVTDGEYVSTWDLCTMTFELLGPCLADSLFGYVLVMCDGLGRSGWMEAQAVECDLFSVHSYIE